MCLHEKFLLALVDNELTREDISEKNGFIGLYIGDINRPYLDKHIFLMYSADNVQAGAVDVLKRLQTYKNYYNRYFIKIKGKPYVLYAFIKMNKDIEKVIQGKILTSLDLDSLKRVFKFWDFEDKDVNDYIFFRNEYVIPTFSEVPEEDYKPKLKLVYNEKTRSSHFEIAG